jgi:hypothetical protein
LSFQPENVRVIETEEELDPREGDIEKGTESKLTKEVQQALESPIRVTLRKGVPVSIQVEKGLPTSFQNIKRAQVSQVIVDTVGANVVLQGNADRQTNAVRQQDKNDDSGFFFETMEKTVHGECQTYYTVSQTGPYQSAFQHEAQDQPAGQQQSGSSSESGSAEKRNRQWSNVRDHQARLQQQDNSDSLETSSEV